MKPIKKAVPEQVKVNTVLEKAKIKTKAESGNIEFPIIGLGASAGGLEALEQFFRNMSGDTGMAFVVIQHLAPTRISIMSELIQRTTPMKVVQVIDGIKVKPNCVYVVATSKSMSLLKGALHLFDRVESHSHRLPIDIFFRSMADDRQGKSIGIILSGMGSDGSLGVKAIKEKNGIVLVQEPTSAKFDSMPLRAMESVDADIIAPAAELPSQLIEFLRFIPVMKTEPETEGSNKSNIEKIILLLREQSGHDFSLYKKNTLFRRIERRKIVHKIDKIQHYVRFLQENPKEVEILYKELLIGVTNFFRDVAVWKMLKESVLPALIKELPDGYVLRAWVTGCSTGEEAYSLAIVFREVQEEIKSPRDISLQIFATDLNHEAIEKARKGNFNKRIAADVSTVRLNRFFVTENDGYRVNTMIREMVVFAPHNVIKDPPFTKLDIITCRNMLIYMEPELQRKLITLFNYSLIPGGIMLLGTAETLGHHNFSFNELDAKLKIYKRSSAAVSPELIDFPSSFFRNKDVTTYKAAPKAVENIQTLADQILLQRFAPPSVLVNDKGDILYITGRTGKYLEPLAGKANWNIYAMAREGLWQELPDAFSKAKQNFEAVVLNNIKIGTNDRTQFADITVQRIESPAAIRGMVMVVFTDVPVLIEHETARKNTAKQVSTRRQQELELQLQRSAEEIRSIREEMESSQEELKSTNEELQSSNEEMQSMNEELQTVNIELQSKVSDFTRANDDMKNLLNSTEVATLFLDKDLNIHRFTDQMIKIFKLRSMDIGRPFTDLVTDLQYPEIETHALQVIKTLVSIETAIETHDRRWFNIRIMPYRTVDDRIDGLVITFSDISTAKKLEIELKAANEVLRNIA